MNQHFMIDPKTGIAVIANYLHFPNVVIDHFHDMENEVDITPVFCPDLCVLARKEIVSEFETTDIQTAYA